jgi:two-component system sensor histidine kinase BaeS
MRLLISHKLFLALLSATIIVVIVALVLTRLSFNRGFLDYVNAVEDERIAAVAETLTGIYAETDSWSTLLRDPRRWKDVMASYSGRPGRGDFGRPRPLESGPETEFNGRDFKRRKPEQRPGRRGPGPRNESRDANRGFDRDRRPPPGPLGFGLPLDLLDAEQQILIGKPDGRPGAELTPIEYNGKVVGYLRYVPAAALTDLDNAAEQQFIAQQRNALYITAGAAILIAALLALLGGRRLVAPIKTLVTGTEELASGQLAQPIPVTTRDELGQLAEAFNTMAASLEEARQTQQQWVADVAHELRTPLAILTGELQALEDGVREWTPASRASLQTEIERLSGLINDLHEISLSDAGGMGYQRSEIDLLSIIERAVDSHRARIEASGLDIELELPGNDLAIHGDARRLEQVFTNLLENSCRYTDTGGRIRISYSEADGDAKRIVITLEDTVPGAPTEALPHLFDRLYRVEESRNRAHGGSGLGLAICKGIIEAHGGTISAALSPLGGLAIRVELPRDHT